MHRQMFFDHGAGGVGRFIHREGNVSYGVCDSCGHRTMVAHLEWHRAGRPQCTRCGGYLQPSQNAQQQDYKLSTRAPAKTEAACIFCRAKLASDNPTLICRSEKCLWLAGILNRWFYPVTPQGLVIEEYEVLEGGGAWLQFRYHNDRTSRGSKRHKLELRVSGVIELSDGTWVFTPVLQEDTGVVEGVTGGDVHDNH